MTDNYEIKGHYGQEIHIEIKAENLLDMEKALITQLQAVQSRLEAPYSAESDKTTREALEAAGD